MDFDINEIGKSVAQIATAVARVLPVMRNWRKQREATPEQLETIEEAFDAIREGIGNQQRLALLFDPQIENYGAASQLFSLVDKLHEMCNENSDPLVENSDIGKSLRMAFANLLYDVSEYDVTMLKRIKDGDFRFLGPKDTAVLQRAATTLRAEMAAANSAIKGDDWDIDVITKHIQEMKLAVLDIKTELSSNIKLLVEILAYTKF